MLSFLSLQLTWACLPERGIAYRSVKEKHIWGRRRNRTKAEGWQSRVGPVHKRQNLSRLPSVPEPINHCGCRRAATVCSGHRLMNREYFSMQQLNSRGSFSSFRPAPSVISDSNEADFHLRYMWKLSSKSRSFHLFCIHRMSPIQESEGGRHQILIKMADGGKLSVCMLHRRKPLWTRQFCRHDQI